VVGPLPYTKLVQDMQAAAKDPAFNTLLQNTALASRLAANIPAPPKGRRLQQSGLVPAGGQHGRRLHGVYLTALKYALKSVSMLCFLGNLQCWRNVSNSAHVE
jgi:hypothetical protein